MNTLKQIYRTWAEYLRPKGIFSWLSILFFLACVGFALFQLYSKTAPEMTLLQGLQQCSKNTSGDLQLVACTKETVSIQLQKHSAAYLMTEIATSSVPRQFGECHGIAHIIGEETYNKFGNVEKAAGECGA